MYSFISRNLLNTSRLSPQHESTLVGILKDGSIVLIAGDITDSTSVTHLRASMVDSLLSAVGLVAASWLSLIPGQVVEILVILLSKNDLVIHLGQEVLVPILINEIVAGHIAKDEILRIITFASLLLHKSAALITVVFRSLRDHWTTGYSMA